MPGPFRFTILIRHPKVTTKKRIMWFLNSELNTFGKLNVIRRGDVLSKCRLPASPVICSAGFSRPAAVPHLGKDIQGTMSVLSLTRESKWEEAQDEPWSGQDPGLPRVPQRARAPPRRRPGVGGGSSQSGRGRPAWAWGRTAADAHCGKPRGGHSTELPGWQRQAGHEHGWGPGSGDPGLQAPVCTGYVLEACPQTAVRTDDLFYREQHYNLWSGPRLL